MLKFVIGVDPGQRGAVSVLTMEGVLESVVDMPILGSEPDAFAFGALLEAVGRRDEVYVALEEPFAVQANASSSTLTQGIGYGKLCGVVEMLELRHQRIRPVDWKRELELPMGKGLTTTVKKRNSREFASKLWPEMEHHWRKANQDGRAESALIGECLRRRILDTVAS